MFELFETCVVEDMHFLGIDGHCFSSWMVGVVIGEDIDRNI